MNVVINGSLHPADHAAISVFDRGFLYGDGLFETFRVHEGRLLFFQEHWDRLERGADFLRIPLPFAAPALQKWADDLVNTNQVREGMLRLTLTRGKAGQGYLPTHAVSPTWVMMTRPAPEWAEKKRWKLGVSSFRLPEGSSLHRVKSLDKILQVVVRLEAQEEGMDDMIILNTSNQVAETTSCNLMMISQGSLVTPPDAAPALPGVTRHIIMEIAREKGIPVDFRPITLEDLFGADAVCLTVTSLGLVEVSEISGHAIPSSPMVDELRAAFFERVRKI